MPVGVVTGGSGGIGRWIALGLIRAGYRVVLIGRTPGRCEDARRWLADRSIDPVLELHVADLSSLSQTRAVGARMAASHPSIDLLVNNAGIFLPRREETEEGHERVMAVNHLAPFLLTHMLLPCLRSAAGGARIVNIGSSTSDTVRIDPDDLEGRRRWGLYHTYGQSKLAMLMTTLHLASTLHGSDVVANVVHPGAVASGLVRARGPIGLVWRAMAPFLLTEEQGADTPLHVALSPDFAAVTGAYVKKRKPTRPNPRVADPALMQAVWQATRELTGLG